jgi:hypothetical protein
VFFAVLARRHGSFGCICLQAGKKGIGIVGSISDQALEVQSCDQFCSLCDIMPLPSGQAKPQRIAQCINCVGLTRK